MSLLLDFVIALRNLARHARRLDALAGTIGLRRVLDGVQVPDAAVATMARDAVANRRLIDPNPVAVTEADAARIYREVLVTS